jgi:glycosyltransferase involved in cell wall biosynthesis
MSIALLEAMARGLPPVITFCGPEEAVIPEETGLCAPPNNPAGLAAALTRLVAEPVLRSRLAASAAEHASRHFSIGRVTDDYLELYRAIEAGQVPPRMRADAPPNARPGAPSRCLN